MNVRNNGVGEKAIDILSISGSSLHFHCSFVADKVVGTNKESLSFLSNGKTKTLYSWFSIRFSVQQPILHLK